MTQVLDNTNDVNFAIFPDDTPENPRDWDNLGTMICWHRRYTLGDKHHCPDPQTFKQFYHEGSAIILPLFLFDHSGLSMSTDSSQFRMCDSAGWDWGQVGYIYVTLEKVRQEYKVKNVTRKIREQVLKVLRSEVATYDQYLRGDVFGFVLTELSTGDVIDSCWGFYGSDPKTNGMLDYIPEEYRQAILV